MAEPTTETPTKKKPAAHGVRATPSRNRNRKQAPAPKAATKTPPAGGNGARRPQLTAQRGITIPRADADFLLRYASHYMADRGGSEPFKKYIEWVERHSEPARAMTAGGSAAA